jgi:hypothetical protein
MFLVGLTLLAFSLFGAPIQGLQDLQKWESFDFSKRRVDPAELQKLPEGDLALLRGIVFGRHGRTFKNQEIQDYLSGLEWYHADPTFTNKRLNQVERENLDLIRGAEAIRHKKIQPGDLRFWMKKKITKEALGEPSLMDLHIMQAEVEAIHGKRFDDEPLLQKYFDDRYWYKAGNFDPRALSAIDRANLQFLKAEEKRQRSISVSPGDMGAFEKVPVLENLLSSLTLLELRLLRNEIYARRGYRFHTIWLAQYFSGQEWYEPGPKNKQPVLTNVDQENLRRILGVENRAHEDLSRKPVDPEKLEGMFVEDAQKLRNEIYARAGRVFKAKWLQSYFASMPWYKPDPKFRDSKLTPVERQNVAIIAKYEKSAMSQFDMAEG